MTQCDQCGEQVSDTDNYGAMRHKCPPKWHVHLVDFDVPGVSHQVYGYNGRDAAENYAIEFDRESGHFPILHRGTARAIVWSESGEATVYDISAEMRPVYGATKAQDQTAV